MGDESADDRFVVRRDGGRRGKRRLLGGFWLKIGCIAEEGLFGRVLWHHGGLTYCRGHV